MASPIEIRQAGAQKFTVDFDTYTHNGTSLKTDAEGMLRAVCKLQQKRVLALVEAESSTESSSLAGEEISRLKDLLVALKELELSGRF